MKKLLDFLAKRKILGGIVILIIILISGFYIFQQIRAPKVESVKVEKSDINQELSLSGEVDADEKANLSFQIGGLVAFVGVKKDDYINQFQTVAALDQRSARKTLEKTLLDYLLQRSQFDEIKEENQNRTAGEALNNEMKRILERNQWDLDLAVKSVELQDLVIHLSSIYSPISGIVTEVNTPFAGVNVAPFTTHYVVVNPQTIYFKVAADQTEVVNVKNGLRGVIVFDSYENEEVKGVVSNISFSPRVNEAGTVYDVKVALDAVSNSTYKYRLGMTGDITFVTNAAPKVLSLPLSFVKTDQKGKFVYTDKNKKIKKYIEIGIEGEEKVEIKGLEEGTLVYD